LGRSIKSHVGGELRSLGAGLAGVFTVGAVAGFVRHISQTVGDIKDMSELLGVSTDEVQRLQKAAADAGLPFTRIVTAMQRIESERAKAMTGDAKASGLFSTLGIDPSSGSSLDVLRRAIDQSEKGAIKNAAAFELLGTKVGGLRQIVSELQQQGPIQLFTPEDIQRIDEATKKLEEAKRRFSVASTPLAILGLDMATLVAQSLNLKGSAENMADVLTSGSLDEGMQKRAEYLMGERPISSRFDPLPLPDRRPSYNIEAVSINGVLTKISESTERTARAIESNIAQ
jgi:hypothetical protein